MEVGLAFPQALRIARRGARNCLLRRPLAVSFEITHSCNANCGHCDKGWRRNEVLAPPERFAEVCREVGPVLVQISGGEPMLRKDLPEIVSALRDASPGAMVIMTTNATLLDKERYTELRTAGINQFSISMDFPDERHDRNRQIPGLFKHMDRIIPELSSLGHHDVICNSVITSFNLRSIPAMLRKVEEWGIGINFSAYTPLRTGDSSFLVKGGDLDLLEDTIARLVRYKKRTKRILTSDSVLWNIHRFFKNGRIGNCGAGYRSMVVNPDGSLAPCAMWPQGFSTHRDLVKSFTEKNHCGGCYVSIRASTDKPIHRLLLDNLATFRALRHSWAPPGH